MKTILWKKDCEIRLINVQSKGNLVPNINFDKTFAKNLVNLKDKKKIGQKKHV